MELNEFMEVCLKAAKDMACDEAEIYASSDDHFIVSVLDGEIDKYNFESELGVNLRVMYGGKVGNAYTEMLDDPQRLILHAIDNAKVTENDDIQPMQGMCAYQVLNEKPNPIVDMTAEERTNIALNLERDTKLFDDRVNRMTKCAVHSGMIMTNIRNTRGLYAKSEKRYSFIEIIPVLRQGNDERSSHCFQFGPDITDYNSLIKRSVDNALIEFNARPVESGEYRILLRSDAAYELLMEFCIMFYADRVQNGLSLLADKLNTAIASEAITLVDDPFEEDYPRAFDDEGVPSVYTTVIENGVLRSYLYNLKTALKDGVDSTSNAGREDAHSPVETMPSNFYIKRGTKSYSELVSELDSGLIITGLGGLDSGINPVSGDFSLTANGLLVDCGSIIRSVNQVTLAGNFFKMMQDVTAVGNDLEFGLPAFGRFGSPSLLIDKLVVAGK